MLVTDVNLGPSIWDRTSEFDLLGTRTRVFERYFFLRVGSSALAPYDGHLRHENVVGREWWTTR